MKKNIREYNTYTMKSIILILIINIYSLTIFSQIPPGYYDSAVGIEDVLRGQLENIIDNHNSQSYSSLWTHFHTTDDRPDGKVWDMYSNCDFIFGDDQDPGSGGTAECQYYNREHSFPKSWFNDELPMNTDLFHLYPTDKYVNGLRSNYPYGETNSPSTTTINGSKLGPCSYPGYTEIIFEPIDEYKGDFARTYFYMATRYYSQFSGFSSPVQSGDNYATWAKAMLLEWHDLDPVSQKEIDRNEEVYDIQGNRNPYIDHPEWGCLVFGSGCPGYVEDPTDFTATAVSESQIDLTWTLNDDNDDVLLAYNTVNTFGELSGTYTAGQTISGGGEVIYVGSSTSYDHQSLITQTYYYKLWSVNSSVEYSTGVETNAMPLLPEPSYNVTNFIVSNETSNSISLTWTDATGGQLPETYLIKASTGGIIPPVDGVPETDGQFVKNVNFSVETVTFSGLTPSTTYFFEIYPYTNSASNINYKTDSPESTIGNTSSGSSIIINEDFSTCPPTNWTIYSVSGSEDWECDIDFIKVNAYNGDVACNDWLISPIINFDNYTDEVFNFQSWTRYSDNTVTDPEVRLKYSDDYLGSGNPENANWTEISYNFPPEDSQIWTSSGDIDLSFLNGNSIYLAFVYTSSGTGAGTSTLWEIDDIILTGTEASTNDADSEAIPPITQIPSSSISSLADTEPEAVDVFSFIIEDKGTSDGLITQVYNIRIYPGTSNTADWTDHIQGLVLNDGTQNIDILSQTVTDTYINLLCSPFDVSDGSSETYTLSVYLNTNDIQDDAILSFMTDADIHGFLADDQFSQFASVFNSGSDIVSNDFIIDVSGTDLVFTQQPSDTEVGEIMNPNLVLQMQDENGNADFDYEVLSVLYSEGVMSGEPIDGIWESGNLTFGDIIHTEDAPDIFFTVLSGAYEINSNIFTIYCNPVNVSNLNATCGNESSDVSWINPECFNEVIIVANVAPITGTPTGNYLANSLDYEDEMNPDFPGGGKVVYNGTNSPQTVTGLTNGITCYFKVFVNAYNMWSSGVSSECTPVFIEDNEISINIYPNPIENILIIDYKGIEEKYSVQLISISGISLFKTVSYKDRIQINLEEYPKGMYIIEIRTEKDIIRKRIILE